ncbi:endothelin-converting enzyme 1-like [Acanthaster planci]|uniref:Endothelin-converting enzyme 1-like n=1 Tax=Acanthaster planci TaxID=133434 RepID=A0A8B7ZNV0_ACAPL|nr:endothelin-converting enzyme 1-like [Acanthaster planci]
MEFCTVSNFLILILLLGTANGLPCNGPKGPLCLQPRCIQTTADILRVMDLDADPCQDFYQFACGNFAKVSEIPEGETRWTPIRQTQYQNQKLVQKFLEQDGYNYKGVRSEALVKAKTYFRTCMNQTFKAENGFDPLLQLIDSVGGWNLLPERGSAVEGDISRLAYRLAEIYNLGIQLLFAMDIGPDDHNSSLNIVQFQQYGLSLHQPGYYEESKRELLDAFVDLGVTVMTLLRDPRSPRELVETRVDARSRMEDIVEFERAMSRLFVPFPKLQDPLAINNKMSLQKFADMMPDFDLLGYVRHAFGRDIGSDREVLVYTPAYFRKLNDLLRDTPDRVLEDYSLLFMTRSYIKYLPEPFREAQKKYINVLTGATKRPTLLDQCLKEVDRTFGDVTGALFVEEKFSEAAKRKTEEILGYIRAAFLENLPRVRWLDKKAKVITGEKARAMIVKIGFPDWILDPAQLDKYFEGLHVSADNALQNQANYKRFLYVNISEILDFPVDKNSWDVSPGKVSAQYDYSRNELVFPAGILQPPFFSNDLPAWLDFCAIINGETTLYENFADNGGLKIAYLAFQRWRRNSADDLSLPLNLTASQEFFLGMGQAWCSYYTPEAAKIYLDRGYHSPEKYRVIGSLSNLPAFSEAFQCPIGSPMNPAVKCEVW